MIESCHDGFKAMYMNMSIFLFLGLFLILVLNSFSCFVNFSVVLSMVAARVIYVPVSEGTVMGCWLANALLFNTPNGLKISVYAINRRNAIKGRPV